MNQEVIKLYDEYTHAPLERREFIERLTKLVGSSAAVITVLPYLDNNYLKAETVKEDDTRIRIFNETYKSGNTDIHCYCAAPDVKGSLPTIVLAHENRGLNPHMKDIARRFALEGFLVFAVDALSAAGGTPVNEDKAREQISALGKEDTLRIYLDAIEYAKGYKKSNNKVATVGFCWGGGVANRCAAHSRILDASVAYYGMQSESSETKQITAPLLLHYAGLDERINKGILDFVSDLNEAKVDYSLNMYANVNHAFNNDTNAARYDARAAQIAWRRTLEFLRLHLG